MAEKSEQANPAPPPYPEAQPGSQGVPPPGQPGAYTAPPGQPGATPYQPGAYVAPPGQPGAYVAPPAGYTAVPPAPPPMVGATTVIVQQRFGEIPVSCNCPNCHQNVVTRTEYEVGLLTWLIFGIIIVFGGWIFCLCFIPFCIDAAKDVRHVCPNCNFTVGFCKRM